MRKALFFFLFGLALPCQADIIVTYVQHLDLVDGITGNPVPGLLGHPTITWTFDLNNFLALKAPICFQSCFYSPVLNQDAINDGVTAPTTLDFIAAFLASFQTLDVEEVDPAAVFQGVQYISIGIDPAPDCIEPCSQTLTGRYSDFVTGIGQTGFSFAQTTDTLVGVLVSNPEPRTIALVAAALVILIAWSRKSNPGKTNSQRTPTEDRSAKC